MAKMDRNKVSRQNRLRKVLTGMGKHLQNVRELTIARVVYQVSDLETRIQKDIDISDVTDRSKAAWQADVQKERTSHKDLDPLVSAIKAYVLLTWGNSKDASDILEDFGYAPRKPRTVKPATQVAAAAKAKATRVARHTMGPKKKLAIHGTVPATVSGASAPASPSSPSSPAIPEAAPPRNAAPR